MESLTKIGLTDSEAKVYETLLEIGDCTRNKLVNESEIAGSKVYEVISRLQKKGLVSTYRKNNVLHFKPLTPKQLQEYINAKQEEIKELQKTVDDIMPALMQKYAGSKEDTEVELLIGLKAYRAFFTEQIETLKQGEYNYVIGGTKGEGEEATIAFFQNIHKLREQKGIKTKMLYNKRQKVDAKRNYAGKEYSHSEIRFIPHQAPVAINIYNNHVLITIYSSSLTAVHIKNQETADSFMEYFKLLWNTAKE